LGVFWVDVLFGLVVGVMFYLVDWGGICFSCVLDFVAFVGIGVDGVYEWVWCVDEFVGDVY